MNIHRTRAWLLCLCGAVWLPLPLAVARVALPVPVLQGTASAVVDGNRLWLQPEGGPPVQVRLADIDAPELCQPWGPDARRALQDLVAGRSLTWKTTGRDASGALVGALTLDGTSINQRMVEDGHAWSQRARSGQGPYLKQERMAHSLGRGLHAAGGAVMPADFRRQHGPCAPAAATTGGAGK